jgi:hypothetical protein
LGGKDTSNWEEVLDAAKKTLHQIDGKALLNTCSGLASLIDRAVVDIEALGGNINDPWLATARAALVDGWATFHTAMFVIHMEQWKDKPVKLKTHLVSEQKAMSQHKCSGAVLPVVLAKVQDGIAMRRI